MTKPSRCTVLVVSLAISLHLGCASEDGEAPHSSSVTVGRGGAADSDAPRDTAEARSLALCGRRFGCTAYPVGGSSSPLWFSTSFLAADGCYLPDIPSPAGEVTRFAADGTGEVLGIPAVWEEQIGRRILFTTPNGSTASCNIQDDEARGSGSAGSAAQAGAGGKAGGAGSAGKAGGAGSAGKAGGAGSAGKAGGAGSAGKAGGAGSAGKAGSGDD